MLALTFVPGAKRHLVLRGSPRQGHFLPAGGSVGGPDEVGRVHASVLKRQPPLKVRGPLQASSVRHRSGAAEVSLSEKETTQACSKFSQFCLIENNRAKALYFQEQRRC